MLRELFRRLGRAQAGNRTGRDIAADGEAILAALARMRGQNIPPAIVVPVHNAAEALGRCVAALATNAPERCRIILVDDASTDPRVGDLLRHLPQNGRFEVARNERNCGFTETANRGFALAGDADVLLLNSDTEPPPRFLTNLRLAAYSADRVGTATALSNNAGAFSAPRFAEANALPDRLSADAAGRLVMRAAERHYPRVPTGNGFCMYLRRDCLAEVGSFDAAAFPRGYGEENDFCMRARKAGWEHVVDDATYVQHHRGASFGEEKAALLKAGLAVLSQRYPDYPRLAGRLKRDSALAEARRRVEAALAADAVARPRRLMVTEQTSVPLDPSVELLCIRSRSGGVETIDSAGRVLAANGAGATAEQKPWLAGVLVGLGIESVVVGTGARHAAAIQELAGALGIPCRPA